MLSIHSEMLLEQYRRDLPLYERLKTVVLSELNKAVLETGIKVDNIDARIKTEQSLTGKLSLKGEKYKTLRNITDILGARVVTFYADEVDIIAASIGKKFNVDWENSIDKRTVHKVDQFGYMSLHFICKLPKEVFFDENYPELNDIAFEIQFKTTLQHAWATIQHDIGYKTDVEVPNEYLRALNRLSGLLEIADIEFRNIRNSINDYRKRIKALVKSGNIDQIELNGDTFKEYIEVGAFDQLNKRIAEINDMDIVPVPLGKYLFVLKSLGFDTLGDVEKMRKELQDYAYKMAVAQFAGNDVDIMTSSVGISLLCTAYIIKKGYGEAGLSDYYKTLYGEKKTNLALVKRTIEIARTVGLSAE